MDFEVNDLVEMRSLIHPKIEQVLTCTPNLWANIMPDKIFNDLVQFTGTAAGNSIQNATVNHENASLYS